MSTFNADYDYESDTNSVTSSLVSDWEASSKVFQNLTVEDLLTKSKNIHWSEEAKKTFHIFAVEFQVTNNNRPSPEQVIILVDRLGAPMTKFHPEAYEIIVQKALDGLSYRVKGLKAVARDTKDRVEFYRWSERWLKEDWNGNTDLPKDLTPEEHQIRPVIPRRHNLGHRRLLAATINASSKMVKQMLKEKKEKSQENSARANFKAAPIIAKAPEGGIEADTTANINANANIAGNAKITAGPPSPVLVQSPVSNVASPISAASYIEDASNVGVALNVGNAPDSRAVRKFNTAVKVDNGSNVNKASNVNAAPTNRNCFDASNVSNNSGALDVNAASSPAGANINAASAFGAAPNIKAASNVAATIKPLNVPRIPLIPSYFGPYSNPFQSARKSSATTTNPDRSNLRRENAAIRQKLHELTQRNEAEAKEKARLLSSLNFYQEKFAPNAPYQGNGCSPSPAPVELPAHQPLKMLNYAPPTVEEMDGSSPLGASGLPSPATTIFSPGAEYGPPMPSSFKPPTSIPQEQPFPKLPEMSKLPVPAQQMPMSKSPLPAQAQKHQTTNAYFNEKDKNDGKKRTPLFKPSDKKPESLQRQVQMSMEDWLKDMGA